MSTYPKAVEVTNNVFLKIFRQIDQFTVIDEERVELFLMGWIRRIAVNAAIDYLRREMNHIKTQPIPDYVWEQKEEGASSDSSVLYKELITKVKELPPAYQRVFNLHVIDGFSHPEIARLLRISIGTSKSNLSKAKAHLQKALIAEYNEPV